MLGADRKNRILEALRERIRRVEQGGAGRRQAVFDFGIPAVDASLPAGGSIGAGLHEVLGEDAARFGFIAALLSRRAGPILWCRIGGALPHGPGIALFGLTPERLILLQAARPMDALWAMEEGLRCQRLAAVLGEGVMPTPLACRRLQLAAEAGGMPAFVLLPPSARPPPSVALTRWRVAAMPGCPGDEVGRPRWKIALLRCRGGRMGEWVLEWDDEAVRLDLVADLADRSMAAAE